MAEYEERYEGNGEEELHNSHPHPHPADSSPQPTHDDLTDSKSHVCSPIHFSFVSLSFIISCAVSVLYSIRVFHFEWVFFFFPVSPVFNPNSTLQIRLFLLLSVELELCRLW